MFRYSLLITIGLILLASSCVPPRHFSELEERYRDCQDEREILISRNEKLKVENTEFKARLDKLNKQINGLEKDSLIQNEALVEMKIKYNNLKEKHSQLKKAQDDILEGSERSTKQLLQQLETTMEENQKREDQLRELEVTVERKKKDLQKMQQDMQAQQERLIELERILNQKDSIVNLLKDKVSAALTGFEGQGLSVSRKNGKVYVSLEEKLLFQSGSFTIQEEGKKALIQLAEVLENNPDINIMIEGHTDDVPYISNNEIKDNWDLSVKRATAVIRILVNNSGIDPARLIAAGRSQYMPVDPAKNKQARAKNRRTEIILTPNLDILYEILNEE